MGWAWDWNGLGFQIPSKGHVSTITVGQVLGPAWSPRGWEGWGTGLEWEWALLPSFNHPPWEEGRLGKGAGVSFPSRPPGTNATNPTAQLGMGKGAMSLGVRVQRNKRGTGMPGLGMSPNVQRHCLSLLKCLGKWGHGGVGSPTINKIIVWNNNNKLPHTKFNRLGQINTGGMGMGRVRGSTR